MFNCNLCNFTTIQKRYHTQHIKSQSHLKNEEKELCCCTCNKYFKSLTSYKTHKSKYHIKKSTNKIKPNEVQKILNNINDVNNNINNVKGDINNVRVDIIEVKEEIHNSKKEVVTVVNKAINKASSLIKYLMEHHRSVPPLKKISRQECVTMLRLDYECPEQENDYSLQKLFIRDHAKNVFITNIAKSILKMINYNNKDAQPIYNTDCTRYNYVVKTTADLWNEDKSGIKFTDYIIRPLLRYIRDLIEKYIDDYLDQINMYKNTAYENELLLDEKEKAYTFDIALTNDYLIKPLLKELSPYLRFLQSELDEIEKLEELEKIQEDLEEIINNNNDILSNMSNMSNMSNNSDISDDDINDNYIKKRKKRMI